MDPLPEITMTPASPASQEVTFNLDQNDGKPVAQPIDVNVTMAGKPHPPSYEASSSQSIGSPISTGPSAPSGPAASSVLSTPSALSGPDPQPPSIELPRQEKDIGVDGSAYFVDCATYANAITRTIRDVNLPVPCIMGIFARWGGGKNYLKNMILYQLREACSVNCTRLAVPPEPRDINWRVLACNCVMMSFFGSLLALCITVAVICTLVCVYMILVFLEVDESLQLWFLNNQVLEMSNATTAINLTSTSTVQPTVGSVIFILENNVAIPLIVAGVVVGIILLLLLLAGCAVCCYTDKYRRSIPELFLHCKLIIIMLLCDMPDPPSENIMRNEMLPVCFNAWQYAGSDKLWPAIVSHLFTEIERYFGMWKTRLYRITKKRLLHQHTRLLVDPECGPAVDLDAYRLKRQISGAVRKQRAEELKKRDFEPSKWCRCCKKKSQKEPSRKVVLRNSKWICFPYSLLITLVLAAVIICLVAMVILIIEYETDTVQALYITVMQGVAGSVLGLTLLANLKNIYTVMNSLWFSQSARIDNILSKAKGNDGLKGDLGYMKKVKDEVKILMGFIKTMEHLYQKQFRICMIIDDLDKCPDKQVVQILEALNILLSDENDPIISILNVDPTILLRQLKKGGKDGLNYISQLVDLKFCLPDPTRKEIDNRLEEAADHAAFARAGRLIVARGNISTELRMKRKYNMKRSLSIDSDTLLSPDVPHIDDGVSSRGVSRTNSYQSIKTALELEGFEGWVSRKSASQFGKAPPAEPTSDPETIEMERLPLIQPGQTKAVVGKPCRPTSHYSFYLRGVSEAVRMQSLESESADQDARALQASQALVAGKPEWLLYQFISGAENDLPTPDDGGLGAIALLLGSLTTNFVQENPKKQTEITRLFRKQMNRLAVDTIKGNSDLLQGSYRKMSQLFNTIFLSLYIWVAQLRQSKFHEAIRDPQQGRMLNIELYHTCRELSQWLLVCEQWPYKASWIIQACADSNSQHTLDPFESIVSVWSRISKSADYKTDLSEWSNQDHHQNLFEVALQRFSEITALSVRRFLPFTVNVDRSIKSAISIHLAGISSSSLVEDK